MRKKILAFLVTTIMIVSMFPVSMVTGADVETVDPNEVPTGDVAWCNFYGKLDSNKASFLDGVTMGITNSADLLFFEMVTLGGLEGRKQYSSNTTYVNIDDSFYEKGDNYFLVNINYYDFGPSEGSYYVEYHTTAGKLKQYRIYKPGRNPGWTYSTAILSDCDLSYKYDNGASIRIQNGAYNAWRRVEVVNLSRRIREKTDLDGVKGLRIAKLRDLEHTNILPIDDPMFSQANAVKPVTAYDAMVWANKYACKEDNVSLDNKQKTLTQAELVKLFMDIAGVDYSKEASVVEFSNKMGFTKDDSLFLYDEAPATYYNLATIMDDVLYYEGQPDYPFIRIMFEKGYFGEVAPATIQNETFLSVYYKSSRINPYVTITDNGTGRTFHYINFYGTDLIRPYLTAPQWLHDGKHFICATPTGFLYLYNIETQVMKFLAQGNSQTDGIVGEDGMIYYHSKEGVLNTFNRIDPADPELTPKIIYRFPVGVSCGNETIAVNGKWFAGDISDANNVFNAPAGKSALTVFHVPEESKPGVADYTFQTNSYKFPQEWKGGVLNHRQANPVYPNLIFFAHETDTNRINYSTTNDRSNIMDLNTGEVMSYNQGSIRKEMAIELTTHESWSADGEWIYFISWSGTDRQGDNQQMPAIVKVRKDGTHRQYYHTDAFENSFNHCFGSSDMKWFAFDEAYVGIVSAETHQIFPIAQSRRIIGSLGHPYHPHAQIARGHYIMSWGHEYLDVLGIAWYDFTHIAEQEKAKGGRYTANDYVNVVSYETLECESFQVEKDGRDCQMTKGRAIYYEINPEIVDTVDDAIRITFDYLDDSKDPLVLTYTKGVTHQNDARFRFNAKTNVKRKGTGRWQQAVIEISSANCENIGKFETDFFIRSGTKPLYISNMKVERMETK